MAVPFEKLQQVLRRHAELSALLALPSADSKEFAKLSREFSALDAISPTLQEYASAVQQLKEAKEMLQTEKEASLKSLIQEEIYTLEKKLNTQEQEIQLLLLPKDENDQRNAIIEFRPAAGGDEAALFCADLFRMYQRYAEGRGWKFEILSITDTGIGGFKEASALVRGTNVFAQLKFESGVHRVQRVPTTEAGGRIHTSTATVAVLPEAEDVDIEIQDKDLRIDVYRSSGAGGQHVNTTDSAVRITHLPTGIAIAVQDERSQHKNKAKALQILRARLFDAERLRMDDAMSSARKSQIGTGDRSERIRTYNYPQGRVTDHRINLTLYDLDRVLAGELDKLIDALIFEEQAEKLAAMEG